MRSVLPWTGFYWTLPQLGDSDLKRALSAEDKLRMGLNGKGHLGISGQIPYSSRMEKTKEEGAGKGPGRQRGDSCPLSLWGKLHGRTRPFSPYIAL